MPDYSKGKIYMIEPTCEYEEGDIYYGSTIRPLSERMNDHRKNINPCKSKILFDKYGVENCRIVLVEEFPCDNREQLNRQEGEHQRENKCVNKHIAGRTKIEYYNENADKIKEQMKEYREANADKIREHKKDYREENADKIREHKKEYREANKGKIKEHKKEYREANKVQINKKQNEKRQAKKSNIPSLTSPQELPDLDL